MITEKQAQTAAKWWRDALVSPKFDNGDDSYVGMKTMVMANMAAGEVPSEEQLDVFEEALVAIIDRNNINYLHSDYGPDWTIGESMKDASIPFNRCPWKTSMWLGDNGEVEVSYGYGAPQVTL